MEMYCGCDANYLWEGLCQRCRVKELTAACRMKDKSLREFGVCNLFCNSREMQDGMIPMKLNCDCGLEKALTPTIGSDLLKVMEKARMALHESDEFDIKLELKSNLEKKP